MQDVVSLLRGNRKYRLLWIGQLVSEVGDNFNNIAVFALALQFTGSGLSVAYVMLARALPAVLAGPVAGVVLDRLDRRKVMIASDLVRAVVALGFIVAVREHNVAWIYWCSALLMFASPFFMSGRSSILPVVASPEELHTANSVTQTTAWLTTAIGAFLGGASVTWFGFEGAFMANALSFLVSAFCIWRIGNEGGLFRAIRSKQRAGRTPWREYADGWAYLRRTPLLLGICLIGAGWATGGGAAQILFSLFGEMVFQRGAAGIGLIWGFAGVGLVIGGAFGNWLGKRIDFDGYKRTITAVYVVHGLAYVAFSLAGNFMVALALIALSRAAVAVSAVLNMSQLLRRVGDVYRGRVFATADSIVWSMMMVSLSVAGVASEHYSPRQIGVVAGLCSSSTALFWGLANWRGWLPEPGLSSSGDVQSGTLSQ